MNLQQNWQGANKDCKIRNMELIAIDSPKEESRILQLIKAANLQNIAYWTSGTDLEDEGNFIWKATGKPFDYQTWHDLQPDNFMMSEHCVVYTSIFGIADFKFNDISCTFWKRYSICFRKNDVIDAEKEKVEKVLTLDLDDMMKDF